MLLIMLYTYHVYEHIWTNRVWITFDLYLFCPVKEKKKISALLIKFFFVLPMEILAVDNLLDTLFGQCSVLRLAHVKYQLKSYRKRFQRNVMFVCSQHRRGDRKVKVTVFYLSVSMQKVMFKLIYYIVIVLQHSAKCCICQVGMVQSLKSC